ncbi:MAG TPA: hypothetical protein VHK28_04640 [Candidatus Limnocylindria bacterium]|nr:hypothetical protein [Candidatus Limnocylindria bacterium]
MPADQQDLPGFGVRMDLRKPEGFVLEEGLIVRTLAGPKVESDREFNLDINLEAVALIAEGIGP